MKFLGEKRKNFFEFCQEEYGRKSPNGTEEYFEWKLAYDNYLQDFLDGVLLEAAEWLEKKENTPKEFGEWLKTQTNQNEYGAFDNWIAALLRVSAGEDV